MLRTALAGAAAGAAAYAAADLAADVAAFNSLQRQALELAERPESPAHTAVERAVGPPPWQAARWHSGSGATLAYSHRGHAARATFALTGPQGVTDVVARGVRGPGYAWNALYHAFGEGRWELASCAAMVPGAGGVAKACELMEPRSLAQAWEAAGGKLSMGSSSVGEGRGGGGKKEEEEEQRRGAGGGGAAAGGGKEAAAAAGASSSSGKGRSWWLWRRKAAAGDDAGGRRQTA